MSFSRYDGAATEYQGESFTRTLAKKDGVVWGANEIASYILVDKNGTEIDTGDLTKTGDNIGLEFVISESVTTALLGTYLLLVYLKDTVDTDFANVIARYTITYVEVKAE